MQMEHKVDTFNISPKRYNERSSSQTYVYDASDTYVAGNHDSARIDTSILRTALRNQQIVPICLWFPTNHHALHFTATSMEAFTPPITFTQDDDSSVMTNVTSRLSHAALYRIDFI